jgi:xanthine dehydrogenase accessory factor
MTTTRRQAATGGVWLRSGRQVVSALLVEIEGSAPLENGATMLIADDGSIEGSITGGCVEAAVAEQARSIFAGHEPKLLTYGISDELAGTVGLTCGGTVRVFLHRLAGPAADVERAALEAVQAGRPAALTTRLDGPDAGAKLAIVDGETIGSVGGPARLDLAVAADAQGMLRRGASAIRRYGADGTIPGAEVAVHVRSFAAPPRMLIFGAVDFSVALARIARELDYEVTICDPREPFIRAARFERVASTLVAWPEEAFERITLGPGDAVLVFTHDPKLDLPAVRGALKSAAGFVGALGSRRTTADRDRRLLEAGVSDEELARLHAPCGLDIGGSTPEEVAISVLAEIVASRSGRAGGELRHAAGPIHRRRT